mgnify:CR=1 FL=1|jgi:hypothetical protein
MNNVVTSPFSVLFGFDKEDVYDIRMANQAHKEWVDGGRKTISHEEMMKRYG